MAAKLSTSNIGVSFKLLIPLYNLLNHSASLVASVAAISSASVVQRATVAYLRLSQDTAHPA
jgi:hypothetical protein